MAGAISSLGLGSGVLTADVVDQLKEAEKSSIITPIEKKVKFAAQKSQALDLLSSLMTTFKASTRELADDTIFLNRTVSGTNGGVEVSAHAGTAVQNFNISDVKIATKSVQESGSFASENTHIATGDGSLNLSVGGKDYTIKYTAQTTLSQLQESIRDAAGESVTASLLQTGDSAYSLILKSNKTGTDQDITLTDNSGKLDDKLINKTYKSDTYATADTTVTSDAGTMDVTIGSTHTSIAYTSGMTLTQFQDALNQDTTFSSVATANVVQETSGDFKLVINPIGSEDGQDITIAENGTSSGLDVGITTNATNTTGTMNEVQQASDASFKYDGITLTRSSNEIEDLIVGVKITLKSDNASANISISQDRDPIAKELENFVNAYNSMIKELGDMTTADVEEGTRGVFFGDSNIRNLGREITNLITYSDTNANSLANFGIDMDESGKLSFNRTDFDLQMDKDPDNVMKFFSGETLDDKGVFDLLDDKLGSYTKTSSGILAILGDGIKNEQDSLNDNYKKSMALLNNRYNTLTERFIAYDAMISQINAQFSSLQMQIDAAINAKK